jgi:hypothetical protein
MAADTTMTIPLDPTTEREFGRTEFAPEERERMLARMTEIKDSFYAAAQRAGHHQFLEFAGLMSEYIKACERMHRAGVDFGTVDVDLKEHEAEYIAEKLDCIFGQALVDKKTRAAFLGALAAKGGWPDKKIW